MTTPTPTRGPCEPWTPIWNCANLTGAEAVTGAALQAATEILYNRSGQQFGLCTFTIRPCRDNCDDAGWGGGWWSGGFSTYPQPALIGGNWYNLTCGGCAGSCSCTPLSEALLPSPVAAITQVKLNGQVLAASGYRVDDFRKLVRLGGFSWPVCQDLTLDDTQDNTWSVTLQIGQEVPAIGQMAVGELALELLKSCLGLACSIPRNASTITRQGLTIDFPSIYELLDRKLLGLYAADLFVSTYNPHGLTAAPMVYDVDGENWRRTTS